jgi:hypothetical protein
MNTWMHRHGKHRYGKHEYVLHRPKWRFKFKSLDPYLLMTA